MTKDSTESPRSTRVATSPSIIRTKIALPPLGTNLVDRPRLTTFINETIRDNHIVVVAATAGSGKTTAVVQACSAETTPVAWLTLDSADAAPGRLLLYIEAAMATQIDSVNGLVTGVLSAGISHDEAAGLLVDATSGTDLILVIDGLEHLGESAGGLSVIEALVRYAPRSLKLILLSRTDVLIDSRMISGVDDVAAVGEDDLAFTTDEATRVLETMNVTDVDVAHAMEVTNGWVAGILFESWRAKKNIVGVGGESDPLHGYLSSQILERLSEQDREFLVGTSLLDDVTPSRALAIGEINATEILLGLRKKHLPVSWLEGGIGMRCHPRFREYLLALFERRTAEDINRPRSLYGDLLVSEGHLEEAVEQYLLVGDIDKALAPAGKVLAGIINRLDFDIADRWLSAISAENDSDNLELILPRLLLAISREDFALACEISDSLKSKGTREDFAATSSLGASIMAWSYWHLNRLDDVDEVIAVAPKSPDTEAVLYLMTLVSQKYATMIDSNMRFTGGPLDGLVMRVHYARGRLAEMEQRPQSPWAAAVSSPWRIGVLRATGHLTQALDVYAKADDHVASLSWLFGIVGPELMIDLHRIDEARRALQIGREHIRASGSIVFDWLATLIEAKLELRLESNPNRALTFIERVERESQRKYDFITESIDTWRGLAYLQTGENDAAALEPLRMAVASMIDAQRIIDLPTAAVYLAEAEWRAGNSDAADDATNLALSASRDLGSHHQLLLALADFESVLARRLDIELDVDSEWHELGRSLIGRDVAGPDQSRVIITVAEFGETSLFVDGVLVRPRIAKSLALISLLASVPEHRVTRPEALNALFEGELNDSSRAYLRQAVHRLREVMPPGLGPAFVGDVLAFSGPVSLSSESTQFERLVLEANRLQGEDKLRVLERALALYDKGEYLPKVDSEWALERRSALAEKALNARLAGAAICFESQRYQLAKRFAESSLASDPFSERAWRMVMRVNSAVGDLDGVTSAFRACEAALAEADLVPSVATRELFTKLRPE